MVHSKSNAGGAAFGAIWRRQVGLRQTGRALWPGSAGAIMLDILHEEVSVAMPLLNYTTKIPAELTAAEIMSILVKRGATDILTHYGPEGLATGLKWRMETASGTLGFSLPINGDAVFEILTRDRVMKTNPAARMQQANRTAWRIIKE